MLMLTLRPGSQSSTMGKKSRVKIQKSGSGAAAAVSPKEMMNLINELLQSESGTLTLTLTLTLKESCGKWCSLSGRYCKALCHVRSSSGTLMWN